MDDPGWFATGGARERGFHIGGGPQLAYAENRVIGAKLLPERVDALRDGAARFVVIGVRPDERRDLLPGDAAIAGTREQRQQRQTTGLRRGASDSPAVAAHGKRSKRDDAQRHSARRFGGAPAAAMAYANTI